jgi:hypothetical protein
MKSIKKQKVINVIVLVALIISIFLSVFFYYSPAEYVKTQSGEIYLVNGEPYIYHTDLFGNTFIFDNGVRVYAEVPNYAGA